MLILALGAVTPSTGQAFIGESLVINPATKGLTEAAKTIITNPTFLPDNIGEAGSSLGVAEESGAAGVFQTAGLLPALGSVVSFGVGTVIGSEICKVAGIEGCWYFHSDGADPATGMKVGQWEYYENVVAGNKPFEWVYKFGSVFYVAYEGTGTIPKGSDCEMQKTPGGMTSFGGTTHVEWQCTGPEGKHNPWDQRSALRSSMANRSLDYHATDDPGISNFPWTAPGEWPTKLGKAIAGHEGDAAAKVGEKIASKIKPSEFDDPYGHVVPTCTGLLWLPCSKKLEELELIPVRDSLTWDKAVLTKPADAVVEVQGAGHKLEIGSKVTVKTNPKESDMPVLIPQPEPGETYSHYAARLNPALVPTRRDLDASFIDPATGPNGVVSVEPVPETRVDPAGETSVKVTTNPADAPVPGAPWSPPGIASIDMGPLSGIPSPCTVFPFGLFCWVGEALAQFNTTGSCPHFSAPVADTGSDFSVTMCGETAETIMGYLRPAILLAFIVGCGFLFARGTKAIGDD